MRTPGLSSTIFFVFRSIRSFIENSGSSPSITFGLFRNGMRRGSSSCTVLWATCTSRKSRAFRVAAHDATFSIRVSAMRSRYFPSRPGAPCATTAMRWSAGCTGVAGSAFFHSSMTLSKRSSILSGGSSPNIPIFFESGLP